MARIAVIDYGMGNILSVAKAIGKFAERVDVLAEAFDAAYYDGFVLPGVGSFGEAVYGLKTRGLWPVLESIFVSSKPYLGICLGMQLLCKGSEESEHVAGFGVFDVVVKKFRPGVNSSEKVPHMGWNQIEPKEDEIFLGIKNGDFFYFCHSYYVPLDVGEDYIIAKSNYIVPYASAIRKSNIWAVQFHPEKSQTLGLNILKNFVCQCG